MLNAAYQHIGLAVSFNSFQPTFILQAASFQSTGVEFCVSHFTVISTCCMQNDPEEMKPVTSNLLCYEFSAIGTLSRSGLFARKSRGRMECLLL
jgi:hypothetical protein